MTTQSNAIGDALERVEEAIQLHVERDLNENSTETDPSNDQIQQTVDELVTTYVLEVVPRHQVQFEQTLEEDIALKPRIDQLREEDQEIVAGLNELRKEIAAACHKNHLRGQQLKKIADQAAHWAERIRSQDTKISKWFSEAFVRDRGFPSS